MSPAVSAVQVRGIIFSSGLRRDVFTAGNDINELYAPLTSKERYRRVVTGPGRARAWGMKLAGQTVCYQ